MRLRFASSSLHLGAYLGALCSRRLSARERNTVNAGVDLGAA
jgi:hypothetical protein